MTAETWYWFFTGAASVLIPLLVVRGLSRSEDDDEYIPGLDPLPRRGRR